MKIRKFEIPFFTRLDKTLSHGESALLLIGIDEAGYGPLLGPLCHGYAAVRVPDTTGESAWDLWRALRPAVGRAGCRGLAIDDSKKVYSGSDGLKSLEAGVRAFHACAHVGHRGSILDLDALLPGEDLADLRQDFWFEFNSPPELMEQNDPFDSPKLRKALAKIGAEAVAVGARATSVRTFNSALAKCANKADASWRVIARELKRLAALSHPDESIFAAIDRQGGRKFYAALIGETFETALVHVECETDDVSVYRIEHESRCIRVGFYVEGDSKHLLVALASMAAKLTRERCMMRMNAFFQRHQPGLISTAGYHGDAQRFLEETRELRARLKIHDAVFIRAK